MERYGSGDIPQKKAMRPENLPHGPPSFSWRRLRPEHFGIVSVDCATPRSKWMLVDFYGNVFIPPTVVEHNRAGFEAAIAQIRQALRWRATRPFSATSLTLHY
jgi:hypothetical protein